MMKGKKINLHIYASPFYYESRMLKQTKALMDANVADHFVIASFNEQQPVYEKIDDRRIIWRPKLWLRFLGQSKMAKVLKRLEWFAHIICWSFRQNVRYVSCHSVTVLPVGVLLKKIKKCHLVYETHELETEVAGLGGVAKKILKSVERYAMNRVDLTVVVSPMIAKWYTDTYPGVNPVLVRNLPTQAYCQADQNYFRTRLDIPGDHKIFLYVGRLSVGRGIDMIVDVFKVLPKTYHAVIVGYGPIKNIIEEKARGYENIHILDPVKPEDVVRIAAGADVGLSLIENICLSYYYCLPNKLFEYVFSGTPVIVSNTLDASHFVQEYDCGWICEFDKDKIVETILSITDEQLANKACQAKIVPSKLNWQLDAEHYQVAYKNI